MPYTAQNARLLMRAMYWCARKEETMKKAFSNNPNIECAYYPKINKYILVNNSDEKQKTLFFDITGKSRVIEMKATEIKWTEKRKDIIKK